MDIIVNADDLGMSTKVNESTFALMEKGLVTSATILANSPKVAEACASIKEFPQCSFGIHLNVTEFPPLVSSDMLAPLLDENGQMSVEKLQVASIRGKFADSLYREFCAQIDKLLSLGVELSHIDSHHHVHTIPRIFPILKKVQRRFHFQKVRITRNIYGVDENVPAALRAKKWLYNFLLRNYIRSKTTQGFSDFKLFYEYASVRKMKHRTCEVMVHPGNPYYDEDEVELLSTPWRESLAFPVRLINYHQLV